VKAGAGIGFVSDFNMAMQDTLHEVIPSRPEWSAPIWLVTHVDLHRTAKVQAFLTHLNAMVHDT
jgi:DNA-binding transcriptional LysR family regulator